MLARTAPTRFRRLVAAVALAASALGTVAVTAAPAQADTVPFSTVPLAAVPFGTGPTVVPIGVQDGDWAAHFRTRVLLDETRAQAGLPPLGRAWDTDRVAGDWAWQIAARGLLQHNHNLNWQLQGYRLYAENVGYGADADQVMQAFMASPGHRDNILRGGVDAVGIGAVRSADGRLWIVEVFKDNA